MPWLGTAAARQQHCWGREEDRLGCVGRTFFFGALVLSFQSVSARACLLCCQRHCGVAMASGPSAWQLPATSPRPPGEVAACVTRGQRQRPPGTGSNGLGRFLFPAYSWRDQDLKNKGFMATSYTRAASPSVPRKNHLQAPGSPSVHKPSIPTSRSSLWLRAHNLRAVTATSAPVLLHIMCWAAISSACRLQGSNPTDRPL